VLVELNKRELLAAILRTCRSV